ncbi:EAL domain-containing protein [Sinomonas atrocyanea]
MNPTAGGNTVADLPRILAEVARECAAARTAGARSAALLLVEIASTHRPSLLHRDGVPCPRTTEAAARVQGALGCSGTVAVAAPGHLAVLAPRTGPRRAIALARSIQRALREGPDGTRAVLVAAPAGIGIRTLESARSAHEAFSEAEIALAAAKEDSPGAVRVFGPDIVQAKRIRAALAEDLDRALRSGGVGLVYQPIVGLQTGRAVGAEALARWRHPALGPVSPVEFVPLADEMGLGEELGTAVLETALNQLARWRGTRTAGEGFTLSVNVSSTQLRPIVSSGALGHLLEATRTDPCSLALELTEESFVAAGGTDATVFEKLRSLGVDLHIDDFGTGYSSISYLRRLPAAAVKVDRSLLGDLAGDPREQKFIRSILDMADALALEAVFEGVETGTQAQELTRLGANLGQGYHFSVPLPAPGMTALLEGWK